MLFGIRSQERLQSLTRRTCYIYWYDWGSCASQHNKYIGNRKSERPEFDAGGYSSDNTRYDEEYVILLQVLAYEDAKTGVCRQGGHLSTLKKTQWERCGVAGQAKAVSAAVSALNKGSRCWKSGRYALYVSGQSYAVNIRSGANRAEMLDENGESLSCFRK